MFLLMLLKRTLDLADRLERREYEWTWWIVKLMTYLADPFYPYFILFFFVISAVPFSYGLWIRHPPLYNIAISFWDFRNI